MSQEWSLSCLLSVEELYTPTSGNLHYILGTWSLYDL